MKFVILYQVISKCKIRHSEILKSMEAGRGYLGLAKFIYLFIVRPAEFNLTGFQTFYAL